MTSRDISLIAKRKVRNATFDLKRLLKISWRRVVRFLISLLQVYLCFLLIETGNVTLFKGVLPVSFISGAFFLNFSIIFLFIAIIYLIVGSDYLCGIVSITVSSLMCAIMLSALRTSGIFSVFLSYMHYLSFCFKNVRNLFCFPLLRVLVRDNSMHLPRKFLASSFSSGVTCPSASAPYVTL